MRVGATLYAARSAVNTSRTNMVLPLLIREVYLAEGEYTILQVECIRCGQRQRIRHTEFLLTITGRDYLLDLSSVPPCQEKYSILGHSQNCWERGYFGSLMTSGEMPGVYEDREPIRIRTNEFGEQYIEQTSEPITTAEQARELADRAYKLMGEIVKPFTKEERRRKKHKKLMEVNMRLIRDE